MDQIKDKTFLITGGAGFIGSHTADALIERGGRVVIVDDLSTGRKENMNARATFYEMSAFSPKLRDVFEKEKPNIVYHMAFNVQVPRSVEDPLMDAQCILDSLNTIIVSNAHKVERFIFPSSGFLYGNNPKRPLDEHEPVDAVSPYAVSKYAVENYITYYHKNFGFPYIILRYATVYGPRQRMGAMADYIRTLDGGGQADIWGDGTKTRDYVFVEDVVRANLAALSLPPDYAHPLFNIGTGKETTLNEVYSAIARLLGKDAKPVYHPDRPGEQIRYALDYEKAKKALNWDPSTSIEDGLAKLIAYFRSRGTV